MSRPKGERMVIGVDFDKTITQGDVHHPGIGSDAGAIPWLTMITNHPRVDLILWTMREGTALDAALRWCEERELVFTSVNGNLQGWAVTEDIEARKTFFDLLIDDCTLGVPLVEGEFLDVQWATGSERMRLAKPYVDWERAGPMLMKRIVDWMRRHRE